jgi:MoaA/NifB/PqqE/SkfB family radical SAM enzyme
MPPNDPNRERPLDHPSPQRPHRVYVALTNHCNRACPWCSTCSSPAGSTWLTVADFLAALPLEGAFQLQLEGGEPTVHPEFWEFVRLAREHPRCSHLVLCTNGVVLPRSPQRLRPWLERLGTPLTVKLSVNHHLLEYDRGLIDLAVLVRDLFADMGGERLLVVNVRLRRGYEDDDRQVREAVELAGLLPHANVFFLQRYGFAVNESDWEPPAPVWDRFSLVNPDGRVFGPDLIARSEGMRRLS